MDRKELEIGPGTGDWFRLCIWPLSGDGNGSGAEALAAWKGRRLQVVPGTQGQDLRDQAGGMEGLIRFER